MAINQTRACLRITGDHGRTVDITAALDIAPSASHDIGQPRSPQDSRSWANLFWSLDSGLPDTATLEAHLSRLCDLVQHRAHELETIAAQGYAMDWFCLVGMDNGQGGAQLSPALLRRIATLPVELNLDIYG